MPIPTEINDNNESEIEIDDESEYTKSTKRAGKIITGAWLILQWLAIAGGVVLGVLKYWSIPGHTEFLEMSFDWWFWVSLLALFIFIALIIWTFYFWKRQSMWWAGWYDGIKQYRNKHDIIEEMIIRHNKKVGELRSDKKLWKKRYNKSFQLLLTYMNKKEAREKLENV